MGHVAAKGGCFHDHTRHCRIAKSTTGVDTVKIYLLRRVNLVVYELCATKRNQLESAGRATQKGRLFEKLLFHAKMTRDLCILFV